MKNVNQNDAVIKLFRLGYAFGTMYQPCVLSLLMRSLKRVRFQLPWL